MQAENSKTPSLFKATCITYLVILAAFVCLRIGASAGMYDAMPDAASDILFSFLSQIVILFGISVLGMYIYRKKQKPETQTFRDFVVHGPHENGLFQMFGFKKITPKIMVVTVVLAVCMYFFNMVVAGVFNMILVMLGHRVAQSGGGADMAFSGVWGLVIMIVLIGILPGVCEETAHRGLLLRGFSRRIGIVSAVGLSALLFGLMHLNIVQFFYATVMGYFMGLTAIAARSIWPAIFIHFFNNSASVYLSFALENGWFLGDFSSYYAHFWAESSPIFYIIFAVFLYFFIVFLIQNMAKQSFIDRFKNLEIPPIVPIRVARNRGMLAIKYYISAGEPRDKTPLSVAEKTLLSGIIFLGSIITIFTFVWGLL